MCTGQFEKAWPNSAVGVSRLPQSVPGPPRHKLPGRSSRPLAEADPPVFVFTQISYLRQACRAAQAWRCRGPGPPGGGGPGSLRLPRRGSGGPGPRPARPGTVLGLVTGRPWPGPGPDTQAARACPGGLTAWSRRVCRARRTMRPGRSGSGPWPGTVTVSESEAADSESD